MHLEKIGKYGTTNQRKRFWDSLPKIILASQKHQGKNVSVTEYQGQGTLIAAKRDAAALDCGGCVCIDTVEINSAGSGYRLGEHLLPGLGTICPTGTGSAFYLIVTGINGTGGITDFVIEPGRGYSTPPSNPINFGGSVIGSGFNANCTFSCTSGTKPAPANLEITFHDVIFDCGCIDNGSGGSRIWEVGDFNETVPDTWDKGGSCGGTARWFLHHGSAQPYEVTVTSWGNTTCSDPPSTGPEPAGTVAYFFLRGNTYRLLVFVPWWGAANRQLIFDGTTTDLGTPIANTVACDPGIAHGGTASIAIV